METPGRLFRYKINLEENLVIEEKQFSRWKEKELDYDESENH